MKNSGLIYGYAKKCQCRDLHFRYVGNQEPLEEMEKKCMSGVELKFLRLLWLFRDINGLINIHTQVPWENSSGQKRIIDFVVVNDQIDTRLNVIEVDGYEYHKDRFISDKQKDRQLLAFHATSMRIAAKEIMEIGSPYRTCAELLSEILLPVVGISSGLPQALRRFLNYCDVIMLKKTLPPSLAGAIELCGFGMEGDSIVIYTKHEFYRQLLLRGDLYRYFSSLKEGPLRKYLDGAEAFRPAEEIKIMGLLND